MQRWQGNEPADEEAAIDEGVWELDPNDPTHPDFDLSEAHGYDNWQPEPKPLLLRRGVVLLITALVIIGLLLPIVLRLVY
jgi:hypothetical protein